MVFTCISVMLDSSDYLRHPNSYHHTPSELEVPVPRLNQKFNSIWSASLIHHLTFSHPAGMPKPCSLQPHVTARTAKGHGQPTVESVALVD